MALWRSTFIVSAMTMLSRVLGLVRDVVLLNVFGAGKDFDTFVVAFRILISFDDYLPKELFLRLLFRY